MEWLKLIHICSPETQREIRRLVTKDLQIVLNELQEEEKNEKAHVIVDKKNEKAKYKKRSKASKSITVIDIPIVFGRNFPSVRSMSEFFDVPKGTIYSWIEKGMDIEMMLKKRGKLPSEKTNINKTVIKSKDKDGNTMYKM